MTAEQMALQIEQRYKTPYQFRMDLANDLQGFLKSNAPAAVTMPEPSAALQAAHTEIANLMGELSQVRSQLATIQAGITPAQPTQETTNAVG